MKTYKIIDNIKDHEFYMGEPVTIVQTLPEYMFIVQNNNGRQWMCGEEELEEIK